MKNSDKGKFLEMMTVFADTYEHPITPGQIDLYFEMLKPFTLAEVWYAGKEILKNDDWRKFPLPAKFIKILDIHATDKDGIYILPESKRKYIKHLRDSGMNPPAIENEQPQIEDDSEPRTDRTKEINQILGTIGKGVKDGN